MAELLVRIGRVSKVDYERGMVAVTYPDLDNATTTFLPVLTHGNEYQMPGIGDDVTVLHYSSGQSRGVVIGSSWGGSNRPTRNGDGIFRKELGKVPGECFIDYDSSTKALTITAPASVSINCNGTLNLNGGVVRADNLILPEG